MYKGSQASGRHRERQVLDSVDKQLDQASPEANTSSTSHLPKVKSLLGCQNQLAWIILTFVVGGMGAVSVLSPSISGFLLTCPLSVGQPINLF